MAKMIQESEGHRLYLKALVHQEQDISYRRHDYLSHSWQMGLWKEEVNEIIRLQRQSPVSVDIPTHSGSVPEAPSEMCARWREKIIEWKYQVVDRFDIDREIVGISTFYLDQYLSSKYVGIELFQVVAMACIYLAIKIHSPNKVTMAAIVSAGNGRVTAEHIEAMELSIMNCLNWRLFPPTSVGFMENFFPLVPWNCDDGFSAMADSLEFSRFLAELSVCAYPFVTAKPSSIAIAAILYCFDHFGLPWETREAFEALVHESSLDVNAPEVDACGKLLRRLYKLVVPDKKHPLR